MSATLPTTEQQISEYLNAPEGGRLEFKTAANSFEFENLVKYCVALFNEGGGKIILGVTDKRPRQAVGTKAFQEPGRTEAGLFERLHRRFPIEEVTYLDRRLLIVHVPSRPAGMALSSQGTFWMRAGDALVGMSDEQLRTIHLESGPDFTAETCKGSSLADLDDALINDFRSRWIQKSGSQRLGKLSIGELLADAELVIDGQVTNAAVILLGRRSTLSRHIAQAEVIFEYRSSEASGPAQERVELRDGLLSTLDPLWALINKRNDRQSYQDGLFRFDIPTFDEGTVREGVLNAVCHRDYRLGGSIFIRAFPRRLEIVSPGGFPPGVSPENVLDQQYPRNRRLAETLARCGLVERSGQGMNIMFEHCVRQAKPLPDFTGSAPHEVRLQLRGTVGNPAFVRFLEKLGSERLHGFSTYHYLVLDAIQRDQPIPESWQPKLGEMLESGVVERVGRGRGTRYLLSRQLYATLGAKGVYTRKRGLDHETNKELLLKHLRECPHSPLRDLVQVLPSLSERGVQRLLNELLEDGRAVLNGKRRWARWSASSKPARSNPSEASGL